VRLSRRRSAAVVPMCARDSFGGIARRRNLTADLVRRAIRFHEAKTNLLTELRMPHATCRTVATMRSEMLDRGFTLVTSPRAPELASLGGCKQHRLLLPFRSKQWWKFPQLAEYARGLERLLDEALPEEALCLATLELRYEPAGAEDKSVDRLHADGSYIRSVVTIVGPTTIYRERKAEFSVPSGQTLMMTAMNRAKARRIPCTLHRRPGPGPERAVIVCSFEPVQEQPPAERIDRRVAERQIGLHRKR
jgi:hypothetical protein